MKESEARTKWCPMVRVSVTPNDNVWQGNMLTNRGQIPADNTDCLCIGSDCMMWESWEYHNGKEIVNQSAGCCGLMRDREE